MKTSSTTGLKKFFLIAGALLSTWGVLAQLYLVLVAPFKPGVTYGGAIIRVFSYMTIWTNTLVACHFITGWLAPTSRLNTFLTKPLIQTGTLVYILIVAIVYHLLLANTWNPTGWQAIVDTVLHYGVPVFYLVYWLLFGIIVRQEYKSAVKWLFYPLLYGIYALIRGVICHEYPYPFVDVNTLGYPEVFRNIGLLALAYYIIGMFILLMNNLFLAPRRS
ncbi:Pr6Pr family membrane protein [Chitinophaga defluvii]|uniref:Pr6Pr family membrane protein n=1 Tax=Chitinophaga defluvii TaxID=3163343 RepID=A0ABV2T6N2_9BACT